MGFEYLHNTFTIIYYLNLHTMVNVDFCKRYCNSHCAIRIISRPSFQDISHNKHKFNIDELTRQKIISCFSELLYCKCPQETFNYLMAKLNQTAY